MCCQCCSSAVGGNRAGIFRNLPRVCLRSSSCPPMWRNGTVILLAKVISFLATAMTTAGQFFPPAKKCRSYAGLTSPPARRALLAARGELGAGRGRERNTARQCSSGLLPRSSGPRVSAGRPSRVQRKCKTCVALRTFSAAPSTSTVQGCGGPDLVRGDTSVASQHSAPQLAVAP